MTRKDWEKQFVENLEKYLTDGDIDAKEDFCMQQICLSEIGINR